MAKKMGFGMIGLGEIAFKSTGHVLRATRNAEMIVGTDPVAEMATSYQEAFGIPCSTDVGQVLANPSVDAVVVSTPHFLHVPLGIQAAEAGKHVVVEKPMATALSEADALIDACAANGVVLSCKEGGIRYHPAAQKAKALIQAGAIGDVMATFVFGASNKPRSYWSGGYTQRVLTSWRKYDVQAGGGILIMNYVYDVDRMRWLTGMDVTRVYAEAGNFRTPWVQVEDFITVTLHYENGALGTITCASAAPGASASGIRGTKASGNRIFGTEGQVVFEDGSLLVYTDKDVEGLPRGEWIKLEFDEAAGGNAYVTYFERFVDCIWEGKPTEVPGEEGRKNLAVLLGAYEAAETHKPVEL